jgi:hypothetical protein
MPFTWCTASAERLHSVVHHHYHQQLVTLLYNLSPVAVPDTGITAHNDDSLASRRISGEACALLCYIMSMHNASQQ